MSECHIVALSGGKDSTAMALALAQIEPRDYDFVCTPTYLNILVDHQAKLIKELSDSSTDNTVKITGLERRIDQRPAPIGITPGQGSVRPPEKPLDR